MVASYQIHYRAYISVGVNVVWAVVALRGITSYRERRHKKMRRR